MYLSSRILLQNRILMSRSPWVMLTKLNTKCFLDILGKTSTSRMTMHKEEIIMV